MGQRWITITGHRMSLMVEIMVTVLTCGRITIGTRMDIGTTPLVQMQWDSCVKKIKVNKNMITF